MANITKVPDGPLIKKKGPFKGSTLKSGGMIKRADGSMSKRGLYDNIRANKGSGKKPTAAMLKQEKKIKANDNVKKSNFSKMKSGGKIIKKAQSGITTSSSYNPETRETTIKKSWSDTKSGSFSNSSNAKANKNTVSKSIAKPTISKTPIKVITKGEREYKTFPGPTAAGIVNKSEIKAPLLPANAAKKPVTPKESLENRREYVKQKQNTENETYLKQNPGKTLEDRNKDIQKRKKQLERQSNRSSPGLPLPNKKGSRACTNC